MGQFDILFRIATAQVGETAILAALVQPMGEPALPETFWLDVLDRIALTE